MIKIFVERKVIALEEGDRVLRRAFFLDPSYVKDDMTVTSFAFKPRKGENGISVNIEAFTTYEESIVDAERFRLFALLYRDIKSSGADCVHKPVEGNYAHAEIIAGNLNKISSKLARLAIFVPFPV
jgi:hypothetical protein